MTDQDTMVTDPSADAGSAKAEAPSAAKADADETRGGVGGQHALGCPGCNATGCAIFGCLRVWESLCGPLLADQPAEERWCRRCGCTDLRACVVDGEACHWVDEEAGAATGNAYGSPLCSACRDAARSAIDAAWRDYAGLALACESPALQRPGCRRAFYVGVLAASRGFRGAPGSSPGAGSEDLASLPVDELEGLAVAAVLALPMVLAPAFAPVPAEAGSDDGET